jgi:hypothetical protein
MTPPRPDQLVPCSQTEIRQVVTLCHSVCAMLLCLLLTLVHWLISHMKQGKLLESSSTGHWMQDGAGQAQFMTDGSICQQFF